MKNLLKILFSAFFIILAVFGSVLPVFQFPYAYAATDVKNDASLSTSLVSYWELEETSSTRFDSHASNNLTDTNTVLSGTGIQGTAADFERTNLEYLTIAAGHTLNITGDLSISMWVNFETSPVSATQMLAYHSAGTVSTEQFYLLAYNNGGNVGINLRTRYNSSSGINDVVENISGFSTGVWYHIVVTASNTNTRGRVYINGSQVGTDTTFSATAPQSVSANFRLGRDQSSGIYFDGLMDEVAVWSKELSSTEVTNLYNSGSGIPYDAGGAAARRIIRTTGG